MVAYVVRIRFAYADAHAVCFVLAVLWASCLLHCRVLAALLGAFAACHRVGFVVTRWLRC